MLTKVNGSPNFSKIKDPVLIYFDKIILQQSQSCKILGMTCLHYQDLSFVLDSMTFHDDRICYIQDRIFYLVRYIDKCGFLHKIVPLDSTLQFHCNKHIRGMKIFQLLDKNHIHHLSCSLIALSIALMNSIYLQR